MNGLSAICLGAIPFLFSSLAFPADDGRDEDLSFAIGDIQEGAVLHREDSVRLKMSNSSDALRTAMP